MDYSFGNWVKRRRKALDLTQRELAQRVGCSLSLIFKLESDERRPSREVAVLLARHLEIPLEQQELFLKVARQEKMVDRLEAVPPLATSAPVPLTTPPKTNLPHPLTSLIGREHELHALSQQLQNPVCRLLTLIGPGGVGKTRLALEVAHQLHASLGHGAYFASLVGVGWPEFIIPAIAETLGFTFSGPTPPKVQLLNYLGDKQLLLVLDNLEHLLDGVELISAILQQAPGVKLLVTSREALHLQAEWTFEVQGLPVPESDQSEALEASSAAELFLQRAQQAQLGFTLSANDYPAVLHICRLVQGLPLALELAAVWVRTLSCPEIAQEIGRSIDFLAVSVRDVAERHRSITAVFDHSWKLLSAEEQRVLQRLSLFHGGFTREAAAAVAGASLPLLSALVDKSLVRHSRIHTGRYDLHELIRQYAAVRLRAEPLEEQGAREQHADYYLTLLRTMEPLLQSHRQKEALAESIPETDNIRAAWDAAFSFRRLDLIRRAAWSLWNIYELRTYFQEGEMLFRRGAEMARSWLAEPDAAASAADQRNVAGVLGALLTHQAFFCFRQGNNALSRELYQASIALLQPLDDDPSALAHALAHYGAICWNMGEIEEASRTIRQGLSLSQAVENRWQIAIFTTYLGFVVHDQGDYGEAYRLLTEAMQRCRALGDPRLIAFTAGFLGRTAQALGRSAEVEDLLREALQFARETGDRLGIGMVLEQLAVAAQARGEEAESLRLFAESLGLSRQVGDWWSASRTLNLVGHFELQRGNDAAARQHWLEACKMGMAAQSPPNILNALAGLATLFAREGYNERSLALILAVLANPASPSDTRDRAEKLRVEVEALLSPAQIAAAHSRPNAAALATVVGELVA
jgi:predicted ATPase/transcriptional regulator with XRE-family HTH domain